MTNEKTTTARKVIENELTEAKKNRDVWRERWLNSQSDEETAKTRDRYQEACGYVDGLCFAAGVVGWADARQPAKQGE